MLKNFYLEGWATVSICLAPFVALAVAIIVLWRTRGKAGHQLRMALATGAFAFVFFLVLFSVRLPEALLVKTEDASSGAHRTLQELSKIDVIELAAVRDEAFYSEIGGCCCSYGRTYAVFGTSLPPQEALEEFIQQLQASGWVRDTQWHTRSPSFIRGDHEDLNVSYGMPPGQAWDNGRHPDYVAATATFSNTLKVRIDYILPTRQVCGH